MSSDDHVGETHGRRDPIRWLLGFGFFVQGFRGFPWLGANFFLTDELRVNPSVLQLLQNSANLPMVAKPIYGIVSDAVYFFGEHRIPYIAIGALSVYLLLSNLGASLVEVANDAIVAEAGKQKGSGELPSFVWMASSLGGIFGNLLGGIVIKTFSARSTFLVFGILALLQFLVTVNMREKSLHLPENHPSPAGIRKHLSDLSHVLRKPEISYSIAWFALSTALVPVLTGTMFFYQTKFLKIDASLLGISKVFGQIAMLLWGLAYNRWLKTVPPRKLITAIQVTIVKVNQKPNFETEVFKPKAFDQSRPNNIQSKKPTETATLQRSTAKDKKEEPSSSHVTPEDKEASWRTDSKVETKNAFDALSSLPDGDKCQEN
ncbi:PREDICTED: probable folate-biopterin transporter 7 [Camelina sativa]|uniref:Probable folate-biopterin transporter 7 n=1 Tax=Camelina sativa TaxID=90675 RepID=A0ABM0T0H3_CAMSA|nr:PREDICTED: probable folate-biopterin transporter 7 [Camelina sativa]